MEFVYSPCGPHAYTEPEFFLKSKILFPLFVNELVDDDDNFA
jgi:hypothetical protein